MPDWPMVALGEIAPLLRRPVQIEPEQEYHEIGARSFGRGLFDKPTFKGAELTWEKLFRIEEGDLVFSNIKAWEGAFAVAQKAHHGKVASHRYLTCVPDSRRALGEFLFQYLRTPAGIEQIGAVSPGSADRNRTLSTKGLAAVRVPLPPINEQRRIVKRIDAVAKRLKARADAADQQETELAAMLRASFSHISAMAPRAALRDVAPLVRRPVSITPSSTYEAVGARAFGRGLFTKPDVQGAKLTWQKLFRIEVGDLVISNIKAWEGAFSVAGPEHHNKVASHRYLTCVSDPDRMTANCLYFYLQSPEGIGQIQAASPGSADRNRTLAQDRLEAITVPVPSLDAQDWFNKLHNKVVALRAHQAAIVDDADALLPAMLNQIFG